jgi:shikimate kinase
MVGSGERDRSVLLTGMMGAGKSRVGRALASLLGFDFVDTDALVEKAAGMRVAEIFAREGEAGFRRRERDALARLPERRCVVALGGGAVVAAENRALLAKKGRLVWLDACPETLADRVGEAEERPLLAGLDRAGRVAKLAALAAERAPAYARAELRVATDGRTVEEICAELAVALAPGAGA